MQDILCNLRSELACKIAIDAVNTVRIEENGRVEIDIKRYAKVEKVTYNTIGYGIHGGGLLGTRRCH